MTFVFHPGAEEEFLSAIDYYEESHSGLGHDFAREVYSAIQRYVLEFLGLPEKSRSWSRLASLTERQPPAGALFTGLPLH